MSIGTKAVLRIRNTIKRGEFAAEESLLQFGRFRVAEKGNYPRRTTGLFHDAEPLIVKKLVKPKFGHWTQYMRKVHLQNIEYYSHALQTDIPFICTTRASIAIRDQGGLDGYLMSEDPKMINYSRAFLYKDQIRQVYEHKREMAFRAREEKIRSYLEEQRTSTKADVQNSSEGRAEKSSEAAESTPSAPEVDTSGEGEANGTMIAVENQTETEEDVKKRIHYKVTGVQVNWRALVPLPKVPKPKKVVHLHTKALRRSKKGRIIIPKNKRKQKLYDPRYPTVLMKK